ncbi:MAG: hypothetical protein AAF950_13965 [Pseudomonadota bacterium]
MINTLRIVAFWICSIGLATAVCPSASLAQANLNLVVSGEPDDYVRSVLEDLESEGMSSIRDKFERMGLNTPQSEAAISVYEGTQNETEQRWTELIGVVESGNSLRQYYGYAFLGGNGWIFLRIDFLRKSDSEWLLANFLFDSNYSDVIAPNLDFTD